VIGHELNDSLAPVPSLAHPGGRLADAPDPERLKTISATSEDRTRPLKNFIEGFACFARLPLCREVVEAHGGRLSLSNRDGGGLEVILWLPPRLPPGSGTMG
jgi:hypothetical protein